MVQNQLLTKLTKVILSFTRALHSICKRMALLWQNKSVLNFMNNTEMHLNKSQHLFKVYKNKMINQRSGDQSVEKLAPQTIKSLICAWCYFVSQR